ncbi:MULTISPECIES: zinc-binding dehydrogenase [Clostridia]|uniref:zinc-binding dehydrogenase n=1 Tax=Clostridia TaxID=186801 RepID=UPI000EA3443A|nr:MULTISPECIES: zinc-binding dehydrogenase [Clostridia]NBJ71405.1 NAD(P)-dependent alcohol dehydrogenase [Roseburia sp. 1XD42-34]RKI74666.1 NAD(P)-dependent alcohol dehydrogenase [Clostridium sp. 1xD42-85]
MKAFVHGNGKLEVTQMDELQPKANEVVVRLKMAGLNRRDLYIPERRKGIYEPLILGSDGAGVIEQVGQEVKNVAIGDEVIINPALRWYENADAPPKGFEILGMPDHGTFAEKITIDFQQIEKKPAHLTWEEASVLALSGLTAFRALFTKGQVKAGDTVFIPGAGSGVATYLIQFAKNIGARVIVSSRSKEKLNKAQSFGADRGILHEDDWNQKLADEQIDLVIDSVGRATFQRSLDVLKKGGKIVVFGATTEDTVQLDLRAFFYGQYQLLGSTMGSRQELKAMLAHVEQYQMHPVVDTTFKLDDIQQAFYYLQENNQFGKISIDVSK